ncbi:MAG: spore germination protein [Halanaerobiales bacterium]|nr:spore germination protein [Halanaerobiales bacterium]
MFKNFLKRTKEKFQPDKGLIADTYIVEGESCLTKDYEDNLDRVKKVFEECSDIVFREIELQMDKLVKSTLIYLDGMVDRMTLHNHILQSMMKIEKKDYPNELSPIHRMNRLKNVDLFVGEVKEEQDLYKLINGILSGEVIFLMEGCDHALIINGRGWQARGIQEPDTESVIRGPREGFVETLRFNTTLIRRKIKDPNLKLKMVQLGKKTNTDVAIMYIQGIAKDELVQEVEKRLKTVNLDGVFESGYIEEFIEDNPYSPFPQVVITERPDRVAGNLLEGRVAIVVDGTPMVSIVPGTIAQFYQTPEDYYERAMFGSAVRIVRLFSFVIATTLTSLYVALVAFHSYLIPSEIVLSVAESRMGVPFPTLMEALFMELVIELVREASIRLPGSIGQVIGIVGALVIGQAAVEAKLASPILIIIIAISAVSSYIVPQFSTSYSLRFIRFPMIFAAGTFGAFGIALVWGFLLIHLCSLESFGEPYLAGIAPFRFNDLKDTIFRFPLWLMKTRASTPESEDVDRMLGEKGDRDDE